MARKYVNKQALIIFIIQVVGPFAAIGIAFLIGPLHQ